MKENSFLHRVLVKLGLRKAVDYGSVEYLRARGVEIGEDVRLLNTTIDFGHGFLVSIGNNVTLTGVHILAHDASTQIPLGVSKVGRVMIGDEVFVGVGTIILPNTRIGSRVIIGAGSVVSGNIPDNTVAAGNPARVIGTYDDYVEKHRRQMQERPVYQTFWADKTQAEKEQMRVELSDGIGYDQ